MEDNKELVTEEVTENVDEQATEELVDGAKVEETTEEPEATEEVETPKIDENEINKRVDELLSQKLGKKLAVQERKLRREYEDKYGKLENVLKAGTGENDLEAITNLYADFYTKKGITIPDRTSYNEFDMEAGAEKEAQSIISLGYEDIKTEVDRLANKGDDMTSRDKIVFQLLASERQKQESEKELASIGVGKEALEDEEFKEFKKNLNPELPIKQQYEMYTKFKPKPKVEQIGSMKTTVPSKIKDYYTPDEVRRLTPKDLDNPAVMKAVENSMAVWYKEGIQ